MASAKKMKPQSWNRYSYVWNNPLALIDPDGMDVKLLDKKAEERVLSTLPEELRKQVQKKIDKNGLLKKGSLNKIKSDNANFQDLKTIVDSKSTVEVITSSKDNLGDFYYQTIEEARQAQYELNIADGMSEEEARADANKVEFSNGCGGNPQSVNGGETLTPDQNPAKNGNWRVIVPDGEGKTANASQVDLATSTAHELYVHAYRGIQGQSFRHEDSVCGTDKPLGPVNARTKDVETRTRAMYGVTVPIKP